MQAVRRRTGPYAGGQWEPKPQEQQYISDRKHRRLALDTDVPRVFALYMGAHVYALASVTMSTAQAVSC